MHQQLKAKLTDFAGWMMPVSYSSLEAEHNAVRTAAGLFDVSHMGEISFEGPGALAAANRLITNDLNAIVDGQALYAGLLNHEGGFVDDVVAYRFNPEHILLCVNASNIEKDFLWMCSQSEFKPTNRSLEYGQLALQGPRAESILSRLVEVPISGLKTYHFTQGKVGDFTCIISRTGYTGEDGFELYCETKSTVALWELLMATGKGDGLVPAGLAARDTLRTEMKYALYGNEIDASTNPFEAGLGWIVKLGKADFVGKNALTAVKAKGVQRKLVGFEMSQPGIPRHGYRLFAEGKPVGQVTSGTMSPSLKRAIGIGYVPLSHAAEGAVIQVEIRGRLADARVVATPFYRR